MFNRTKEASDPNVKTSALLERRMVRSSSTEMKATDSKANPEVKRRSGSLVRSQLEKILPKLIYQKSQELQTSESSSESENFYDPIQEVNQEIEQFYNKNYQSYEVLTTDHYVREAEKRVWNIHFDVLYDIVYIFIAHLEVSEKGPAE